MQRFLVGRQDTSHLKIIPVLGYSNKCVISAVTSRGGTVGGTGLRARCSPCAAANPLLIASDAETAGCARGCSNCNQRRDLLTEGSGRRSLPPAQFDAINERSMAVTVA